MHPRKVVEMNVNAVKGINDATTALAEKMGIEIAPLPDVRKYDPELGRAMHLEYFAGVLAQINEAFPKAKKK